MNDYEIRIMSDGIIFNVTYFHGSNALEAFESSVNEGVTQIPFGFSGHAVMINNNNGLAFKIEICQAQ